MNITLEPVLINIGGVQKWQKDLDSACAIHRTKADMLAPAVEILMEEAGKRFMGMAYTEMFKHTVGEFMAVFNRHIMAAGVDGWAKDELKFTASGKQSITFLHHRYTYKFNIFKREVDFYDNGNKIYTYRSEWVQRNIGDEHSFCIYALRWMAREGVVRGIIDGGYTFSGICGTDQDLKVFVKAD